MANIIKHKPIVIQKRITISQLAKTMNVSRGMLYYQHKQPLIDNEIKILIESVLSTKGKESYGHKRIALDLKFNRKRILRVMRKFNIKPYRRRKQSPLKKADIGKPPSQYKNLIQNFCPIIPNFVWASDFTYISYQYKFIYLSTIMDIFSREIIGFNISRLHNTNLICSTIYDALKYTTHKTPTFLHSDQGSEYDSKRHTELANILGIQISMSKKASPWENGFQESFYSQFKLDLGDPNRFKQLGELVEEIEHIIYRHNNVKTHSVLKTNPVNFRKLWEQKVSNFNGENLFNELGA